MRRVLLDIRDVDHSWWEKVEAYQDAGTIHFPCRSVNRLGEIDPATGEALLVSGMVEAKPGVILIDGVDVPVWSVGAGQITARLSRGGAGRDRT